MQDEQPNFDKEVILEAHRVTATFIRACLLDLHKQTIEVLSGMELTDDEGSP